MSQAFLHGQTGGSGGSSITETLPPQATGFTATAGSSQITFSWTNPTSTYFSGVVIIRKEGSYPTTEIDGVKIYDGTGTTYTDTTAVNGTTYYCRIFTYNSKKQFNTDITGATVTATPVSYVVYGVRIDTTNSNPETAVIYTDNAIGFTGGSTDWDTKFPFNVIKPCLLLNGAVNYYLSPSDFTKKADDVTASDITSGNAGDVMIEIPKMAYMIYTEGNYVYVKITNNQNASTLDSRYHYYAHTRSTEGDKNKLYVGAYLGYKDANLKLRSLSGKTPTASQTIRTFRTQAQANGSGYDLLSFYPLTLLQVLYVIRYKNLDSQTALGRGYVDGNSAAINTGGINAKGFYFGETTGKLQMKFMGIEDFWGNIYQWVDGLYSDSNRHILTAFQSFNDTGSGYIDRGQGATSNLSGYISAIQGTTESAFIPNTVNGSISTYYCDSGHLSASSLPIFGGNWCVASSAGAFLLDVYSAASFSNSYVGARLMYL